MVGPEARAYGDTDRVTTSRNQVARSPVRIRVGCRIASYSEIAQALERECRTDDVWYRELAGTNASAAFRRSRHNLRSGVSKYRMTICMASRARSTKIESPLASAAMHAARHAVHRAQQFLALVSHDDDFRGKLGHLAEHS